MDKWTLEQFYQSNITRCATASFISFTQNVLRLEGNWNCICTTTNQSLTRREYERDVCIAEATARCRSTRCCARSACRVRRTSRRCATRTRTTCSRTPSASRCPRNSGANWCAPVQYTAHCPVLEIRLECSSSRGNGVSSNNRSVQ